MLKLTRGRRSLLAAATAISVLFVAACGTDDAAPAASTTTVTDADLSDVTLRVGTISGIGEAFFNGSNALSNKPFNVEWSQFASASEVLEALRSGSIDTTWGMGDLALSTLAGNSSVELDADSSPFRIVGTQGPVDPDQYPAAFVVAQKSLGATTVADLAGKKIAYVKGGWPEALFAAALKSAGLTPADVEVVNLPSEEGLAAFQAGKVDAWIGANIQAQPLLVAGATPVFNSTQAGLPTNTIITTTTETLETNPVLTEAIGRFVVAAGENNVWQIENPSEYLELLTKVLKYPEAAALATQKAHNTIRVIDPSLLDAEQRQADLLHGTGAYRQKVDVSIQYDDRFNDRVAQFLASH